MRALFVGLGSIGRRHLGNLAALCRQRGIALEAWALRSSGRALPPEAAALLAGEWRRLPPEERFDVAFITNPTHLHAEALRQLAGRVGCFFIEKPIFAEAGVALADVGLAGGQKAYVAAPMRWTALYPALKQRLQGEAVYAARVICSSYLPAWRSTDYRTVYSAKAGMGGGVTLDLIHEWDYLADLFGMPLECRNMRGRFSHLEIDSDDLSVYIACYAGMLCEVHLDYFGRRYRRTAEFFCRSGSILADFGAGTLTDTDGSTADYAEEANRRYEREMAYFIDYALGDEEESVNSPGQALRVLALATDSHYTPQ